MSVVSFDLTGRFLSDASQLAAYGGGNFLKKVAIYDVVDTSGATTLAGVTIGI